MATRAELLTQIGALDGEAFFELVKDLEHHFRKRPINYRAFVAEQTDPAGKWREVNTTMMLDAADEHDIVLTWLCRRFGFESPAELQVQRHRSAIKYAKRAYFVSVSALIVAMLSLFWQILKWYGSKP